MPLQPDKCYIIGDIGSNHMGNQRDAVDMIATLSTAGADAAKFQLFKLEDIAHDPSLEDPRTVLPVDWVDFLANVCNDHRIDFMCTPFAPWAVEVLNPYVETWKIASFEAKRRDVWAAVLKTKKPIIASTGRGDTCFKPTHSLYCVSKYPTPPEDIYLGNETTEEYARLDAFQYDGFSDHTTSTVIPALAVARGAKIIEKHFRLDKTPSDSPDYPHSLTPSQFTEMVEHIRLAELTCWRQPPESQTLIDYANRREVGADGSHKRDVGRPEGCHRSESLHRVIER